MTERKWKEAKLWFWNKHEGCFHIGRIEYDSAIEMQRPGEVTMRRRADISHRYFQLKSGNRMTGSFLRLIGNKDSDYCKECHFRSQMNVLHIMFSCTVWRNKYTLLCKEHETEVSPWPDTVMQLLESRKATAAGLQFLATTETGKGPKILDQE